MASESPWKVLSERLGVLLHGDGGKLLDDGHQLSDEDTQDMLVGRALRVARDRYEDVRSTLSVHEHDEIDEIVLAIFDDYFQDANLCFIMALELLDAVGYPASS